MNLAGVLRLKFASFLLVLLTSVASTVSGQEVQKAAQAEQPSFGVEDEKFEHQVPLNKAARVALESDEIVASALQNDEISGEDMPDDWFTAAEVHLSSATDPDLVVRGNRVFLGAYTTTFWVLRKSQGGYSVVLSIQTQSLELQKARTNGLCNILAAVGNLNGIYTLEYAFDGKIYKLVKRTSEPNGYKSNVNLDSYKDRKSFVQVRGQNQENLLAEARDWIWTQWQARATAYVRISTQDDDGEEHDCSYFIEKNTERKEWQITLKIHEIVWDQDSPAGPRYMVTQDNIFVATELERIAPPVGEDSASTKAYSPTEKMPGAKYRLRFLDWNKFTVHIQ